jgi:hypothetical protein
MKEDGLVEVNELEVEELEERIAPSSVGAPNASSTGRSHGSTPEVPVGAHPQPNPKGH